MKATHLILLFLLGCIVGLSVKLCHRPDSSQPDPSITTVTDTIVVRDTLILRDTIRQPHYIERTTVDTIKIKADTTLLRERMTYHTTIDNDSVRGEINAVVSGVDARLDTLSYSFIIPTKETFIEKTVTVTKQPSRFYWGVGVGVGYGLINRQPDVFVGITAGFRF